MAAGWGRRPLLPAGPWLCRRELLRPELFWLSCRWESRTQLPAQ